jgi:uncharacterized protein YjbI with pentapeptide repeats
MRRKLFVLTVAALMATMMITAGPAHADLSIGGGNGFDFDGLDFDGIDLDGLDFAGLDIGDDDIDGNNGFFGFGGGIQQDSDSGELSIGSNVS